MKWSSISEASAALQCTCWRSEVPPKPISGNKTIQVVALKTNRYKFKLSQVITIKCDRKHTTVYRKPIRVLSPTPVHKNPNKKEKTYSCHKTDQMKPVSSCMQECNDAQKGMRTTHLESSFNFFPQEILGLVHPFKALLN